MNLWGYFYDLGVGKFFSIIKPRSHEEDKGFLGGASGKEPAGLIPGLGRSPGGGHATPSSILTWRIPRTEEPGGLQSIGSQRVGHD